MAGQEIDVLVENQAEAGIYTARSMRQAPEVDGCVLVRTDNHLSPGALIKVKIVDTLEYDLIGKLA
jgi:ribosomal protein S12 methylthiotransferase